jgi:hypothetical protein
VSLGIATISLFTTLLIPLMASPAAPAAAAAITALTVISAVMTTAATVNGVSLMVQELKSQSKVRVPREQLHSAIVPDRKLDVGKQETYLKEQEKKQAKQQKQEEQNQPKERRHWTTNFFKRRQHVEKETPHHELPKHEAKSRKSSPNK